jgi:spermidine synthase
VKIKSNILKLALFATGLAGIVAEYILSTLATYFLGDSVLQWTLTVSIMLFAMGLGSRLSKYLTKNLLVTFVYIELILSLLTSYASLSAYTAAAFTSYTGLIIYSLSISIGILIGMEIPLVIRLNDEFEELSVNVSSVMEKDYFGSLIGGLFFAFVGLPYLGLTYTPFILGGINFFVAMMLLYILWDHLNISERWKTGVSSLVMFFILGGGVLFAKPIIFFGEQSRYKDKIVYAEQSRYQRIVLTQWKNEHWLFLNGNQQLSSLDEEMYHEPLVHSVMSLSAMPKNILVLGGGDGCAVREILKYSSVEKIDLVDLDPAMTKLGQTHPVLLEMNEGALNNSKVNIFNQDAYTFLEQTKDFYDVIIVDLPDPKTIEIGRMYSFEFYRFCYRQLRPNGLLITQAGSPYYATRAFQCIDKSMQEAGFATVPMHNQVLTLGEWGWVAGAKHLDSAQFKQSLRSLDFQDIPTKWINQEAMLLMTSFGKNIYGIETAKEVEVNKVHHPVLHKYYLDGNWDLY